LGPTEKSPASRREQRTKAPVATLNPLDQSPVATHGYGMAIVYPDSFLEIRFQELTPPPPATGLCAGFDNKVWQGARLAAHLFNWLPYAALNQENQLAFSSHNFLDLLRAAAAHIYKTKKTEVVPFSGTEWRLG
jgi:hypothetical protein